MIENKPAERLPREGTEPEGDEPASPNAKFDVHHVDPARLRAEIKKDLGILKQNRKEN